MRLIPSLFCLVLCLSTSSTSARELVLLDFVGYGWESAGFPPSQAGDVLEIPVIVDDLSAALGIDLEDEELTGHLSGLVSEGATEIAPGLLQVRYTGGTLTFHRDPGRDHDFGVDPPNATSPSTFTNGKLCLRGALTDFLFLYHVPTGSGSMQASVTFTEGECLVSLSVLEPEGFTFGGFLTRMSTGTVVDGYDMQLDGFLEAEAADEATCRLDCLALTRARLTREGKRDHDHEDDDERDKDDAHKGDRDDRDKDKDRDRDKDHDRRDKDCRRHARCLDSSLYVAGVFTDCAGGSDLDPASLDLTVRIGDFAQTFPAGSLRPEDDGEHGAGDAWSWSRRRACGEISELEIERSREGIWEFEIEAEGIATTLLLAEGKELQVDWTLGTATGSARVELRDKHDACVYHNEDKEPCDAPGEAFDIDDQPLVLTRRAHLRASPNPFRKATTLYLETPSARHVAIEIYDLRGRIVRALHRGPVGPGERTWAWDGNDAQGIPVASGIYFYRVTTATKSRVHKLVRMK